MLSMMGGGKPEGHPEGGDPGKCPFAMMMKAAEARPDMVEKWKAEAAECDSDSSEDEEEAAAMEALLATHAERSAATRAEMEATVRELEGQGEERERRERMMQAMKHQFSKQGAHPSHPSAPCPANTSHACHPCLSLHLPARPLKPSLPL